MMSDADARPEGTFWTNDSVRAFAEGRDPLDVVVSQARDVVLDAVQAGWSGPPFDPLHLARRLGIEVVAREDLADARVVARGEPGFRIEFNPTRPRGRLRYSIAHEIAHTFFPDVGDEVRHRTAAGAVAEGAASDDWQLELLCNVAAGELLVPSIALPADELDDAVFDINRLMELRARFDVSTEAMLRRVAQATTHAVTMFAAARVERLPRGTRDARFRLDYTVGSRAWHAGLRRGLTFTSKVLGECTAVGYTAVGAEQWADEVPEVTVESVGIPPYPGQRLPRVAGLLVLGAPESSTPSMTYVTGDAAQPRGEGPRLVVHVTNDAARAWGGSGFAAQLRTKHPQAAQAYRAWTIAQPDNLRLGHVHIVDLADGISVASMVAQEGYGDSSMPRLRYHALADCLGRVREAATSRGASVHMPRIGTGQGGGAWPLVADQIDQLLCAHGIPVTVYIRPGERDDLAMSGAHYAP